ncbi:MAG: thioredoxin [Candidatus Bathyarchaeia archaeon]
MSQTDIKQILKQQRTVAVVGLSRDPEKDSHRVADYLRKQGYRIIPVNPTVDNILGQRVYKTLLDIPPELQKTIEVVDIFRPAEDVLPIVDQAIQLKLQHGMHLVVWMQLGIVNEQAAQKAQKAGLTVVMDKCMMKEHKRLSGKEDSEVEKIKARKMAEMKKTATSGGEKLSIPVTVTDASFDQMTKYPLIVIDCWAEWCGPCRMIAPVIEELAKEQAGKIVFGKLNVDENPETAAKFNIMSIPTLLVMKNGVEVDRIVGVAPKLMIENKLKRHA